VLIFFSSLNIMNSATVSPWQVLGDTLRLIHFPAMSIDEFTKIVVPAGLLQVDEENAVFRALLGASSDPIDGGGGSQAESSAAPVKMSPAFPRNSRNFVTTRCDLSYDGFMRHGACSSSLFRGGTMPQRNGWTLTVYCDHNIKVRRPIAHVTSRVVALQSADDISKEVYLRGGPS